MREVRPKLGSSTVTMSFLKVKRKCEEDPREVLILANKKFKLQEISDKVPIFELASSAVEEKDINEIIKKTVNDHDVKTPKCNLEKLRNNMRKDNKEQQRSNRYQLYTAPRKLEVSALDQSVPVIDVLDGEGESQKDYVYDLYYSSMNIDVTDPDFSQNYVLHEVSHGYDWDHQFESEDEENAPDDDDSNDENNWRNDYPDEEESSEDESDEDFLSRKMRRTRISSDYSLSSSDFDAYDDSHEADDYFDEIGSDSHDEC